MNKNILSLILCFSILIFWSCRDDYNDREFRGPDGQLVSFTVEIESLEDTRSIDDESKIKFEAGELIHIYAEYDCESKEKGSYKDKQYGIMKYAGRATWNPLSDSYQLIWPNEAVSATFRAYYMSGSTGAFTENTMAPKLLSDYKYDEIPMACEVKNVKYGAAARLVMKRLFSHLVLTELREGISDQLWFTIPGNKIYDKENTEEETVKNDIEILNNAFRFELDPEIDEVKPVFMQLPDAVYKDKNGNGLVYISSNIIGSNPDGMGEMRADVSFLIEPKVYGKFDLLYPRSRDAYSTYLSYGRDLSKVLLETTGYPDLKPNGRYVFSILRSLGVIIDEAPEENWDKSQEAIKVDVEKFLKAVNSGSSYAEDTDSGKIEILESTTEGTMLLRNVDFDYRYYDILGDDNFLPVVNRQFNGNYHYIQNLGCPLFYQNNASIINLGIKNVDTSAHPLISSEKLTVGNETIDNSYNGIITSRNYGIINNVRVSNIRNMTVQIQTTRSYEPSQEAHNVSLLLGVNNGNVYDLYLAGEMNLTVENFQGNEVIPRVSIGGLAGQNLGIISGVNYIDEEGFTSPQIQITNKCQGENGVYKIGGLAGNHTGTLEDIFIPYVSVDSKGSSGLQSEIGGLAGDCPSSATGVPVITGCIVRGEVQAGKVAPQLNLESRSYTGGISGAIDIQAKVENCSISVGAEDTSEFNEGVEYAMGGAFGSMTTTGYQEGGINKVSCFGSRLNGYGFIGNFAGITSSLYPWNHYEDKEISVRKLVEQNIGAER